MLPRGRTLPRKLFPRHTDAHILWNGGMLRVRCYMKAKPEESARFAIVVSKKQYPSTAARNLFKRRVFGALHGDLSLFDKFRFGRYVIFPKGSVDQISYTDITKDINALIAQCSR